MKFIFSFLFFVQFAYARDIIVIAFHQKEREAQLTYRYLTEDLNISPRLIAIKKSSSNHCQYREAKIVVCLKDNEEQVRFMKFDHQLNQRALSVFWNDEKKEALQSASLTME